MKCPTDGATLTMSERSGIEIDYCPECRGVWLDRGELDKILERAEREMAPQAVPAPAPPPQYSQQPQYEQPQYGHHQPHRRKKKESFLSELFD